MSGEVIARLIPKSAQHTMIIHSYFNSQIIISLGLKYTVPTNKVDMPQLLKRS